jgi:hypothetical protein
MPRASMHAELAERGVHVGRTRDERLQSLIAALYAGRLRAQVEEEYGGFTST